MPVNVRAMSKSSANSLAKRLVMARDAAAMSQEEVAQAVGMTQPSYSALERGASLRTYKIGSLAHVLSVDAYWLETGKGEIQRRGSRVAETRAEYMPYEKRRLLELLDKLGERRRKALLELLGA